MIIETTPESYLRHLHRLLAGPCKCVNYCGCEENPDEWPAVVRTLAMGGVGPYPCLSRAREIRDLLDLSIPRFVFFP